MQESYRLTRRDPFQRITFTSKGSLCRDSLISATWRIAGDLAAHLETQQQGHQPLRRRLYRLLVLLVAAPRQAVAE